MMDDEVLKLECLKLAVQSGHKDKDAQDEALRMFNMLKGRSNADDNLVGGGKARVVGKDSDIPLKDYVKE